MSNPGWTPLLWFAAVIALIPIALWLLKRTPLGQGSAPSFLRTVAQLSLSPSQRIVTIEVGSGDARQWLVLGVTPQSIQTLHTLAAPPEGPGIAADGVSSSGTSRSAATFKQVLAQWRGGRSGAPDAR
jgi:flagellar protein FliO/FliZ